MGMVIEVPIRATTATATITAAVITGVTGTPTVDTDILSTAMGTPIPTAGTHDPTTAIPTIARITHRGIVAIINVPAPALEHPARAGFRVNGKAVAKKKAASYLGTREGIIFERTPPAS